VRSSGSGVRVTRTPEDTEVVVVRRVTEEGVVSRSRTSSGRKTVEEVGGGVETFGPETRGQRGLNQKSAHDIVCGANHAFGLAVLGRSVRTRHAQLNTMSEKEGTGSIVIELTPVVTLDGLNCDAPGF
jgi:hypothetical protein